MRHQPVSDHLFLMKIELNWKYFYTDMSYNCTLCYTTTNKQKLLQKFVHDDYNVSLKSHSYHISLPQYIVDSWNKVISNKKNEMRTKTWLNEMRNVENMAIFWRLFVQSFNQV